MELGETPVQLSDDNATTNDEAVITNLDGRGVCTACMTGACSLKQVAFFFRTQKALIQSQHMPKRVAEEAGMVDSVLGALGSLLHTPKTRPGE